MLSHYSVLCNKNRSVLMNAEIIIIRKYIEGFKNTNIHTYSSKEQKWYLF